MRYVAVAAGQTASTSTTVESISTADGSILRSLSVIGSFGTPFIAQPQDGLGLSADGRTLVLADVPTSYPHTRSAFSFFSTHPLEYQTGVSLKGDFAFDALSPDGRRLYLIQHVDPGDPSQLRYVVRALDVTTLRSPPGRIADRTQKSWIMRGSAVTRTTSPGGRWVYTLYDNPGGYPFVDVLDTVRGVAHCVGLPWTGAEAGVYNMRLSLRDRGRTLAVGFASGRRWMTVDTRTWRVSPNGGVTAWWAPALTVGAATLVLVAVAALLSAAAARGCASTTSSPCCSARRASRSRSPSAPPASLPGAYDVRTISTYGTGLTTARISVCTCRSTVGLRGAAVLLAPDEASPRCPGSACSASRTASVSILPSFAL